MILISSQPRIIEYYCLQPHKFQKLYVSLLDIFLICHKFVSCEEIFFTMALQDSLCRNDGDKKCKLDVNQQQSGLFSNRRSVSEVYAEHVPQPSATVWYNNGVSILQV